MAAILYGGRGAVAAGRSAACLWGIERFGPGPLEIYSRHDLRASGVIVRHRPSLPLEGTRRIASIPVATVERTILDLSKTQRPKEMRGIVRHVLRRRLTTVQRLEETIDEDGRSGVRGIRLLRSVLAQCDGREAARESELEDLFAALMRRAGLAPIPQYRINHAGRFIKRPDFAFVEAKIAIELDGKSWHGDSVAFEQDRETDVVLGNLGWRVLRFTWTQLRDRPEWVVTQVRTALHLASAG
jgi:very-short-patch-repair endonuclease